MSASRTGQFLRDRSVVDRVSHTHRVAGSIPAPATTLSKATDSDSADYLPSAPALPRWKSASRKGAWVWLQRAVTSWPCLFFPANHKRAADARGDDGPETGHAGPVDTVPPILERRPGGVVSVPEAFDQSRRSEFPAAFSMCAGRGDRLGWFYIFGTASTVLVGMCSRGRSGMWRLAGRFFFRARNRRGRRLHFYLAVNHALS